MKRHSEAVLGFLDTLATVKARIEECESYEQRQRENLALLQERIRQFKAEAFDARALMARLNDQERQVVYFYSRNRRADKTMLARRMNMQTQAFDSLYDSAFEKLETLLLRTKEDGIAP